MWAGCRELSNPFSVVSWRTIIASTSCRIPGPFYIDTTALSDRRFESVFQLVGFLTQLVSPTNLHELNMDHMLEWGKIHSLDMSFSIKGAVGFGFTETKQKVLLIAIIRVRRLSRRLGYDFSLSLSLCLFLPPLWTAVNGRTDTRRQLYEACWGQRGVQMETGACMQMASA